MPIPIILATAAWPTLAAATIGLIGTLSAMFWGAHVQKKMKRSQEQSEVRRRSDEMSSANISAQVDLTKDVLENWKDIVKSLGTQISDLHKQVAALEERERRCQIELMGLRARILEIEGHIAKGNGGGG